MDAKLVELKERLERILKESANVATELDVPAGTWVGVPHYSVIELRVHETGRHVSRLVQKRQMGEVVAAGAAKVRCPTGQSVCESTARKREVMSIGGPVELLELKLHRDACRHDCFPSAGSARV